MTTHSFSKESRTTPPPLRGSLVVVEREGADWTVRTGVYNVVFHAPSNLFGDTAVIFKSRIKINNRRLPPIYDFGSE